MKSAQEIFKGEFETLHVRFISLLRGVGPANRRPVVIKSAIDGVANFELTGRITKVVRKDGEKPIIYICIYEPDIKDTQEDFAKAVVIKRTAHDFLKNGLVDMIDENHNFKPGAGKLVESQILNSTDDDRYPGIRKGAWVAAIEPSDEILPYLDELTGASLAGSGTYKSDSIIQAAAPQMKFAEERPKAQIAFAGQEKFSHIKFSDSTQ